MFILLSKSGKVYFWQMKCTNFKHILALLTYALKSPVFEQEALKKSKMEPGHPVDGKHVVFGQIADGDESSMDILRQIEAQGSESGDPQKEVTLLDVELVDVDTETLNCSC